MKINLAFLLLIISPCLSSAELDNWIHLGAPPQGYSYIEIRSEESLAPVILAGTLSPAKLNINGHFVNLKMTKSTDGSTGLWVNGRERSTTGEGGRFFLRLEGEEAATSFVAVVIRTKSNVYTAEVELNNFFLDSPYFERRVHPINEKLPERYHIERAGKLESGHRLLVQGKELELSNDGNIKIDLFLTEGATVVPAELITAKGGRRILNTKYTVKKIEFDQQKTVLSFRPLIAEGELLYIEGRTNPGAQLQVMGQIVPVDKRGQFSVDLRKPAQAGSITFDVSLSTDHNERFQYAYTPNSQMSEANRNFWSLHLMQISVMAFFDSTVEGKVLLPYSQPLNITNGSLAYRRLLRERFFFEARYKTFTELSGHPDDLYAITVTGGRSLSAGIGWQFRRFGYSFAVENFSANLEGKNYSPEPKKVEWIGFTLGLNGLFRVSRQWYYTPRFEISTSAWSIRNEAPTTWSYFLLYPLGFMKSF